MRAPRWAGWLLARLAPPDRADELVGDLEETHRQRVRDRGRLLAWVLTSCETFDMAFAVVRERSGGRYAAADSERVVRPTRRSSPVSLLDLKLGARMLVKYPWLTAVGGASMAFAIAVGAGTFEFMKDAIYPSLPWEGGDRVVRVQYVDTRTSDRRPVPLEDFLAIRGGIRSLEHVGAFHLVEENLNPEEGADPVRGLAVTAAAFEIAQHRPILGRSIVPSDEAAGAPVVALLGYDLWRSRFAEDPGVIGRVVRLGSEAVSIVGVLPEDFAFPAPVDLLVSLRPAETASADPGRGVSVFAQLAPDRTVEEARAEVASLGLLDPEASSEERRHLSRNVVPFVEPIVSVGELGRGGVMALSMIFLIGLVVVACVNVALLVFARAATRESEIAVRSALGASRARILGQLFGEAVVLAALATAVGLAVAAWGLKWVTAIMESQLGGQMPPWLGDTLSPSTIVWATVLGIVCAVVAGVIPGLKVTGRDVRGNLQRGAGRGSSLSFGGVWSAIIVTQVALTALFVPIVMWLGVDTWRIRAADLGVVAAEYLTVALTMEEGDGRFAEARRELERRLQAEPGVAGVTMARQLPGGWHPRRLVEVEGVPGSIEWRDQPQMAFVEADFFDVLGVSISAGRPFGTGEESVVVVNESFVREMLGGQNAVGRRIRFLAGVEERTRLEEPGPWLEIVGVIDDVALTVDPDRPHNAGVYQPLAASTRPVMMAVHVPRGPEGLAPRVRALAATVEPDLRVQNPRPMTSMIRDTLVAYDTWFRVIVVAGGLALLLTHAGIYAVMSFTVSRRTREIGVRRALGAEPWRVLRPIFARVVKQVAGGVLAGAVLVVLLLVATSAGTLRPTTTRLGLLAAHMVFMTLFCLAACAMPMRRALRIEPTEALRDDN